MKAKENEQLPLDYKDITQLEDSEKVLYFEKVYIFGKAEIYLLLFSTC